jgi:arylsulfatase A-like enzyme
MSREARVVWSTLVVAVAFHATAVHANVVWGARRTVCEPPNVFYSSRHASGVAPCCPTDDGVCPGGAACPASGTCAGGAACLPTPVARPNVVLMIADDQGECYYGSAGECRSQRSGTPIPAPATPALDGLAAAGTVFPVAHNSASWCYPSLTSILTGRYHKSIGGARGGIGDRYVTVAATLRALGRAPGTVRDPFSDTASIGGYCTLQGGKFTATSGRNPGFDASLGVGSRSIGRIDCEPGSEGGPPRCGSDMQATYDPMAVDRMRDVFEFMEAMVYKKPGGAAGEFAMQQFFVWYAPRIPHQPLRAPRAIGEYLFGGDGMGGLFALGGLCGGGPCPPVVQAFDERNFGTVREYYANIFLADAGVGEIRKFLQRTGEPHCIGPDGHSRFGAKSPGACNGTWATSVTPDPLQNTILIHLSDNGWQLPNSKHRFTENGYRTRLLVFDPRRPAGGATSDALVHAVDILPSVLGYALDTAPGTQACPTSDFDGTACDGRDFRAQLGPSPAPASALRRTLCGHETRGSAGPSRNRYLLTGVGTTGRCVLGDANACTLDVQCAPGEFCLAGRCAARGGQACTGNTCPAGTVCLAGTCQGAPCVDDASCQALLGSSGACVAKATKWCANDPDVACSTSDECPACPTIGGRTIPCRRLCEPRRLKMYDLGGRADMTDLLLDPDEERVHENGPVAALLSDENGPYGQTLRQMSCCLDDWWDAELRGGSLCGGATCPAALTCNQ